MKNIIVAAIIVCLASLDAKAQDSNTLVNSTAPAVQLQTTNPVVTAYVNFFQSVGEVIDIGGTYTARFNSDGGDRQGKFDLAPSVSMLAKAPGLWGTWHFSEHLDMDWAAGATYSYVPKWEEHYGGFGVAASLLRLPNVVEKVQNAAIVPAFPRLTIVKAFISTQVRLNEILSTPEAAITAGLALPF